MIPWIPMRQLARSEPPPPAYIAASQPINEETPLNPPTSLPPTTSFPPIERAKTCDGFTNSMCCHWILGLSAWSFEGHDILGACTDNPMLSGGLDARQANFGTATGVAIGLGMVLAGSIIDNLGQQSENLDIRLATMVAGDACTGTGVAIMTTPLAPIIGSMALGASGPAAATTAVMSWLTTVPVAMISCCVTAIVEHEFVNNAPYLTASTTRRLQYSQVMDERERRAEAANANQSPVMR